MMETNNPEPAGSNQLNWVGTIVFAIATVIASLAYFTPWFFADTGIALEWVSMFTFATLWLMACPFIALFQIIRAILKRHERQWIPHALSAGICSAGTVLYIFAISSGYFITV